MIKGALFALVLLTIVGCSNYQEQCHQVTPQAKAAGNAFVEMRRAARVGNRKDFDRARKDFDASVAKLAAMNIEGDSLKETMLRTSTKEIIDAAPKAAEALQRLADTMKANPDVLKEYEDTHPPLTAGEGVTKELEAAVAEVAIETKLLSTLNCR